MTKVVTGLFKSSTNAALAIDNLDVHGINPDQISLVAGRNFDVNGFGIDSHSKLPEGVAIGGTGGAAVGAIVAGLTTVGALATGGAGLLVAGPLIAAFAGAGIGAAGGSVLGGLVGLAFSEHEVRFYEDALDRGYALVGVECENADERKLVTEVFENCEAEKISNA